MSNDARQDIELRPKPIKFKYSLRLLFIVTTCVCLWLGYKTAIVHRAHEIVSRHNLVANVLAQSLATLPENTFYRLRPPGSMDQILLRTLWPERIYLYNSSLQNGLTGRIGEEPLTLDVSGLALNDNQAAIVHAIEIHFSAGLTNIGLLACSFNEPLQHGGLHHRTVLRTQSGDIQVIIDVSLGAKDTVADVTILTTDSQQLRLW